MAPGRALPPRRLYRHKPGAVTRAGRGLLQPSRHLRAVHQRGKGRDQVDPAVMPHLRRQRRPPSTSCARLQSGQLHADAGDTRSDQGLVADQLEGKADQDWREGRQPWALRGLPTRRGRGVAADVRGYPVADRPVADTTRPGMTGRRSQMRQSTTAEARLDGGKQRVPAPRAHAARHFCCQRAGCYRISLRRRRDDGKIIPTEPGIWGMSVSTKILWGPSIAGVDTVSAHQSRIEEEPMAPSVFHASPEQPATVLPDLTLYASLELSRSTW